MTFAVDPPPQPSVEILGGARFPVRRIFCIGKNYSAHVREMGGDPNSDPPVFFNKPADAVVPSGATIAFAQATSDLHFEGELVVALQGGGRDIADAAAARALIFGHAAGCDLTRRDLQAAAKRAGGPWDTAKAFDQSAPISPIAPIGACSFDQLGDARLRLFVNGATMQDAPLSAMIWSVPEIIIALSRLFELRAGDLIFTGTPEGVGPLRRGDRVEVSIGPLPKLEFSIGPE
jgi:fumarylpyruvate hydrolase